MLSFIINYHVWFLLLAALLVLAARLSPFGPPAGLMFSRFRGPVAIAGLRSEYGYNGVGEASAYSIFGLMTVGDASINAAKIDGARQTGSNNAHSLELSHIDYEWFSIIGVGRYKIQVYFYDPNKA